jgi:hypothetical protein
MANIKITDLTAYTSLIGTDVIPIVDVTNDQTKKVSVADIQKYYDTDGSNYVAFVSPAPLPAISLGPCLALTVLADRFYRLTVLERLAGPPLAPRFRMGITATSRLAAAAQHLPWMPARLLTPRSKT